MKGKVRDEIRRDSGRGDAAADGGGKKKEGGRKKKKKTKYQQEVEAVMERKKKLGTSTAGGSQNRRKRPAATQQPTARSDVESQRKMLDKRIESLRKDYKSHPNDLDKALDFADALRERDLIVHDGGTYQLESIRIHNSALKTIASKRDALIAQKEPTNVPLSGPTQSLNEELLLERNMKSLDGLYCSVQCSLGKQLFMANMFERAVTSYDACLAIAPDYLDALTYRASTLIILGRYEESARDYTRVLELDKNHLFMDAFTGLAKILVAKESAVPGGWDNIVSVLNDLIPQTEGRMKQIESLGGGNVQAKNLISESLKRMHLAMFSYHDSKTHNSEEAWDHLTTGYRYKMSALPPFDAQMERQRVVMVQQVFKAGFWPANVGSDSRTPIFIVGFPRSGSTLLERVLDAHPLVVGTGEDSVFNGRLDEIRNTIVETSVSGGNVGEVAQELADGVVRDMRRRWETIEANNNDGKKSSSRAPLRFVDKMLTNYMNIGFIHLLFPHALILHVAREPMDTLFSAYKHDFPPGGLDYTSSFPSLTVLYQSYRDVMTHWDKVLPGRVTHVRYEDMVADMPGMARAIVDAAGLEWDPEVLNFHRKKHAVNTLSTTQVRKGVYKSALQAWRKYEDQLKPLSRMAGDYVEYGLKTSLPSYVPTAPSSEGAAEGMVEGTKTAASSEETAAASDEEEGTGMMRGDRPKTDAAVEKIDSKYMDKTAEGAAASAPSDEVQADSDREEEKKSTKRDGEIADEAKENLDHEIMEGTAEIAATTASSKERAADLDIVGKI